MSPLEMARLINAEGVRVKFNVRQPGPAYQAAERSLEPLSRRPRSRTGALRPYRATIELDSPLSNNFAARGSVVDPVSAANITLQHSASARMRQTAAMSTFQDQPFTADENVLLSAVSLVSHTSISVAERFHGSPAPRKVVLDIDNSGSDTGAAHLSADEQQSALLGLLSRVGAKADEPTKRKLAGSVVLGSESSTTAGRDAWRAGSFQSSFQLPRSASLTQGGGDPASAGLILSAVHNPLFDILERPPGEESEHEDAPDHALVSRVCHLDAAAEVARRPPPDAIESEGQPPDVVWRMTLNNFFRSRVIRITQSSWFDLAMNIAIVFSCVTMAMEHPRIPPESTLMLFLDKSNLVLTIIFGVECALKIVTFGFVPYWKKSSNKVDLLIVLFDIFMLIFENSGLTFVRTLRSLRAVKALRVATRSDKLQQLINSMLFSLSSVLNVTILLLICVTIFAILGTQLFSGLFYSCTDTTVSGEETCVGTYIDERGDEVERRWLNGFYNFDSLPESLVALFVVSTLEGYSGIMQSAISAPPVKGIQPQVGNNPYNALFFVCYVFVVVFVMLNLYVGALAVCLPPVATGPSTCPLARHHWLRVCTWRECAGKASTLSVMQVSYSSIFARADLWQTG